MSQEIFTFIERRSFWLNAISELETATLQLANNPKKFIIDLAYGDPSMAKQRRYWRMGMTIATSFWLFSTLGYGIWHYSRPAPTTIDEATIQHIIDIAPLTALPPLSTLKQAERAGGGGGGGRQERTPPSQGRLPLATLQPQVLPPSTHPATIEKPLLPVIPSIEVQPELIAKQSSDIPLGLPTGVPGPPSDGPGKGGGIGTGENGGLGSGKGPGFGPGVGGNTGEGPRHIGGSDQREIYAINSAGLKRPQILYKQKPKYTEDARRDKVQGTVLVSAIFRENGAITDIKILRGLGYGLDEEAIKAAMLIKFVPGEKNGQAVAVRAQLEFNFTLL